MAKRLVGNEKAWHTEESKRCAVLRDGKVTSDKVISESDVGHLGDAILPTVHDQCWRMGGHYHLCVGVEFAHQGYEPSLPLKVQTGLGLVHENDVGLLVLGEHGEQYEQYLLFAARQAVGRNFLFVLKERQFIALPIDAFAGFGKQFVDNVEEACL